MIHRIAQMCVEVHKSVEASAEKYYQEMKRRYVPLESSGMQFGKLRCIYGHVAGNCWCHHVSALHVTTQEAAPQMLSDVFFASLCPVTQVLHHSQALSRPLATIHSATDICPD